VAAPRCRRSLFIMRTQESVILDDASANPFSASVRASTSRPFRSLCLPLTNRANSACSILRKPDAPRLHSGPDLRAETAAAGRDLAGEYTALRRSREREAKIRRLVEANIIGIVIWNIEGQIGNERSRTPDGGYDTKISCQVGRVGGTNARQMARRATNTRYELATTGVCKPREGILPQRRQSRPGPGWRRIVRGKWKRGCRFRARFDRAQKRSEAALRRANIPGGSRG
jgi:hypothetical protein